MRRAAGMALLLLGTASCTTGPYDRYGNLDFSSSPTQYLVELAGRAGTINDQDRRFVYYAGIVGLTEIAYGNLAQQKAQSTAVRDFALQLVADHREADHDLGKVAVQQAGILPPDELDPDHIALHNQLAALPDEAFDRAYIAGQVRDHENAIALFQDEALRGGQPNLQRYAGDTLPMLQRHLERAQQIGAQLGVPPAQ